MNIDKYPFTGLAEEVIDSSVNSAKELREAYVGTEHLMLGLLRTPCVVSEVAAQMDITAEKFLGTMEKLVTLKDYGPGRRAVPKWSPRALDAIENSWKIAQKMGSSKIGTEHIMLGIFNQMDNVAMRLLNTMNFDSERFVGNLCQAMGEDGMAYFRDSIEERRDAGQPGGTPTIDRYSRDMTQLAAEGRLDRVIGRDAEIGRLLRTLSRRTKNNPCLIGEPGVGKTAIVERLAQEMASGNVPDALKGKRLLALDMAAMVAGTKYRGEFEERIENVIREAAGDGRTLLFMDELHTLIGAGGAEGALDAANILKPALSRGEIQIIGATTVDEYRKHIEKDAALERRFQPIMVEEPSEAETEEILKGLKGYFEEHHKVRITDEAAAAAARLSARYINDRFLPDKALDVMDEACARVVLACSGRKKRAQGEGPVVDESAIADVIGDLTKIPVSRLTQSESEKLADLENQLHKRIISQDEAVKAVSNAVRRGRVGLKDPKRPVGSFLFLGPTGVGKTELARALASALFGRDDAMIRVDMSEYMEAHSVSKLIGSPPGYVGYDEGGQLSEKIRRNPYCVLLFDEIEKAHPDIFHVLLQILDDGHITDAQGRKIDFKNTIIIMTSNAGAERIVSPRSLGFTADSSAEADYRRMKEQVMEEVRRLFKPEFLNRIDEILVFRQLESKDVREILGLQLRELKERIRSVMGFELKVTPAAKEHLMKKGFDPKYGARPLRRAIQTELEDPLSLEVLAGRASGVLTAGFDSKTQKIVFR